MQSLSEVSTRKRANHAEREEGKAMPPSSSDAIVGIKRPELLSYEDWVELDPGSRVRVQRVGDLAADGTVDDVAEDASCFWVWLDDGRGRVLISERDGSTVWAHY